MKRVRIIRPDFAEVSRSAPFSVQDAGTRGEHHRHGLQPGDEVRRAQRQPGFVGQPQIRDPGEQLGQHDLQLEAGQLHYSPFSGITISDLARLAKDPRFIIGSVHLGYRALTGQDPLAYPDDTEDPLYGDRLTAWQAQDGLFREIGDAFVADEYNFKTILTMVVMSAYYRGATAEDELDDGADIGW